MVKKPEPKNHNAKPDTLGRGRASLGCGQANENGSESFHSRYDAEEEAKQMAAMMDKAAREGRE
jgi:hypothetical protein